MLRVLRTKAKTFVDLSCSVYAPKIWNILHNSIREGDDLSVLRNF